MNSSLYQTHNSPRTATAAHHLQYAYMPALNLSIAVVSGGGHKSIVSVRFAKLYNAWFSRPTHCHRQVGAASTTVVRVDVRRSVTRTNMLVRCDPIANQPL